MTANLQSPQAGGGLLPREGCNYLLDDTGFPLEVGGGDVLAIVENIPEDATLAYAAGWNDCRSAWNRRASTPAPSGLAGEAVAKPFAWAIDAKFKSGGGCSGEFRDEAKALSEAARLRALDHTEDVRLTPLYAAPPSIPAGGVREALEFYARAPNWRDGILLEHIPSSVEADGGKRARAALATLSLPAGGVAVSDAQAKLIEKLRTKIAAIPEVDRGFHYEAADYLQRESIQAYGPIARMCMFVIDNAKELEAALSPEAKTGERS